MSTIAPYAKAVTAALVAGLTALLTALDDGAVSRSEWVTVAVAFLGALGAVWAVPNARRVPGEEG
jgi:hypothetical protein